MLSSTQVLPNFGENYYHVYPIVIIVIQNCAKRVPCNTKEWDYRALTNHTHNIRTRLSTLNRAPEKRMTRRRFV